MVKVQLWVSAVVIVMVVLVGGVYGYVMYNGGSHITTTSSQTTSQSSRGSIETISNFPPPYNGPSFINGTSGLTINVTLSNPSVEVGRTLCMRVMLMGEEAFNVGLLRLTIVNSNGQKVYDAYVWLPHTTLTPGVKVPQEQTYNICWTASISPTANVTVMPGNYTFIMEANNVTVKGTIEVVK